jgi:beta-aspartyl-peptidase (threonine type)
MNAQARPITIRARRIISTCGDRTVREDQRSGLRIGPALIGAGLLILTIVALEMALHAHSSPENRARQAIQQVLETQAEAWNRGDLEGFMVGYWKSEDLSFFSDKHEHGWQATLDRYRKRYQGEGNEMGTLSFRETTIDVLGRDSAWVRGRWHLATTKGALGGLFTLIFKKTPDGWRIVHDHTSKDPKHGGAAE